MQADRRVTTIPASISRFTAFPVASQQKRKVAAYARVSTDSDEQFTSYEAQIDYYTSYIKSREEWKFISVYTDEGITGTSTKRREGFKQMIADALAGQIDLIVTKSVSRFARNTVDSLTTIRKLKERGTEVYFEKENIWTFDSKGELLITIMSSLAQEESRSISENCTWGQRKRMADGKVTVPFGRFLGYDRGDDGNLVVNPKEAGVVREIYRLFLSGLTPHAIAKILTERGIATPGGKTRWIQGTVQSILTNEKYKGDALLQKCYTADFLTKRQVRNHGEIPQYYVENNHEAIIPRHTYELVQQEIQRRKNVRGRYSGVDIFASRIRCGECGAFYGAKVWHSNSKYRKVIYRCNSKYGGGHSCKTPHLQEEEIKALFVRAVNQLLSGKDEVIANLEAVTGILFDASEIANKKTAVKEEMNALMERIQGMIAENAHVPLEQSDYVRRYDSLASKYEALMSEHDRLEAEITDKVSRRESMNQFITILRQQDGLVREFDENLWGSLVEVVTVYSDIDVRFTFRNGTIIPT
ncbi:recombinase family protein [Bacillota bacterium Meth-B3]